MDFAGVLQAVTGFLDHQGARYAVIGGVALVMYGLPRTTLDLDLVVDSAVQDQLIEWLEAQGYQTLHRSSGYSNHSHSVVALGDLDFVYVQGETAEKLFAGCHKAKGPGGLDVPVPSPEHLVALKVFSLKNDPDRAFRDQEDLRFLLHLPGVDQREARGYFERYGLGERFDEIL
ncbi:MAG TPA: hypothetical protein VH988_33860 [Thermoanaerobaculia bacterium]|jgi:hypothetical protein|nr:hypothetical protein [Thermoanaerobaculia bacterium]